MEEITTEKIKERIRENLRKAKQPLEIKSSKKTGDSTKSRIDSFLWKYGTRYAKIIKKVPVLKNIAEKHYWRLAFSQTRTVTGMISQQSNLKELDFAAMKWHYHSFLEQIKKEGIKGKVKLFIFKFIGFLAYWQEQINRALYQELTNQKADIEGINDRLTTLSRTEDALYQELTNQRTEIEQKDKRLEAMINARLTDIQGLLLKKDKAITDLNRQLIFISRKLDLLNYELKKKAGLDISQTIKEISNKDFSTESYSYFAFEDMFRGSRDMIKDRQSQYLDYITEAYQKSKGSYLLDIGCGRGEFLELLAENNIPSKGVDINEENIHICKEHELEVKLIDALEFLKSVKNNSLIGITAFQVIEHLNTEYLIELIKASFQKIKDGGVVIFETVNPYSLYSLRNFFIDLTHRNPIPPDTLKFLVEASGFRDVEVKFLSPVSDEIKLKGDDENIRKLNEILFGYQDYAIIGRK